MDNMNMQQNYNEIINNDVVNQQNDMYMKQQIFAEQEDKDANILAGTSLACIIGSKLLSLFSVVLSAAIASTDSGISQVVLNFMSMITGVVDIGGLVTMIIVRVKYPQNKLGKAAMWTYIVIVILEVIAVIVMIAACAVAGVALLEACRDCPG